MSPRRAAPLHDETTNGLMSANTQQLAQLIAAKHDVLTQVRQLARRQVELVEEGDVGKLLGLLAAKQGLMLQLQDLERELDPFRRQDPDSRRWPSAEDRQRTRELATRCESLLSEIMVMEKNCETNMIQRRDAAASRLAGVGRAAEAAQAYSDGEVIHRLDVSSES